MDNELFGERHEQEENGLFGKRHEAEQLIIHVVVSTSNCEHTRGGLILRNNEWFMECRKCGDLY